ncbi:hypothetical protein PUR61_41855 [Streptomyces sp. BE20]|uniref:hypothetical protein n=1 Tax=Streptomyces sp. BE20 TaxID=3002525 RepID=UPI002E794C49|nr:hypothetical protein [Streptomyces sp. BE20]MEE1828663.1 hypothetical protein [Streptomyces sp. BE20]
MRDPAHLVVDPIKAVRALSTEPSRATAPGLPDHMSGRTSRVGDPVPVDVLGVASDTAGFRTYA